MRDRAELQQIKVRIERLGARVDELGQAQQAMLREVAELRAGGQKPDPRVESRLAELDERIRAGAAAQERAREELVTSLSKTVTDIVNAKVAETASARTAPPPPRGPERGYEHVVKPGETLSQIATAYKVSVKTILQANRLANPDALRVGQKLFIPE